jgi:hypothetical protein
MQPDKKPDRMTNITTGESTGRLIVIFLNGRITVRPDSTGFDPSTLLRVEPERGRRLDAKLGRSEFVTG